MSSPTSVEQLINMVLDRIGYPEYIGNIFEGTKQARIALNNYAETRDEVLRSKNWPFALRWVAGASSAGAVIPSGWTYAWTYPTDCLRVRAVTPTTIVSPDYDPQSLLWTVYNDQTQSPAAKVILTQITGININYVGQVTNPATWEPLFVNALVEALCVKMLPALRKDISQPLINPIGALDTGASTTEADAPNNDMMPQIAQGRRNVQE